MAHRSTAEHLQQLVRDVIDAINNRTFDLDHPAWQPFHPAFGAEIEHSTFPGPIVDREYYLRILADVCRQSPGYKVRVMSMDVDLREKAGRASIFVPVEVEGLPVGVIRRAVMIWELVRCDEDGERRVNRGDWRIIRSKGADGMDGTPF